MPHVSVKKKLKLASIYQRRTQKIEIKTLIDATPDLDSKMFFCLFFIMIENDVIVIASTDF